MKQILLAALLTLFAGIAQAEIKPISELGNIWALGTVNDTIVNIDDVKVRDNYIRIITTNTDRDGQQSGSTMFITSPGDLTHFEVIQQTSEIHIRLLHYNEHPDSVAGGIVFSHHFEVGRLLINSDNFERAHVLRLYPVSISQSDRGPATSVGGGKTLPLPDGTLYRGFYRESVVWHDNGNLKRSYTLVYTIGDHLRKYKYWREDGTISRISWYGGSGYTGASYVDFDEDANPEYYHVYYCCGIGYSGDGSDGTHQTYEDAAIDIIDAMNNGYAIGSYNYGFYLPDWITEVQSTLLPEPTVDYSTITLTHSDGYTSYDYQAPREDGLANFKSFYSEESTMSKRWLISGGRHHRENGPAYIRYYRNGSPQKIEYSFNGVLYSRVKYNQDGDTTSVQEYNGGRDAWVEAGGNTIYIYNSVPTFMYRNDGSLRRVEYRNSNGDLHGDRGPAVIEYDENGNITNEEHWAFGEEIIYMETTYRDDGTLQYRLFINDSFTAIVEIIYDEDGEFESVGGSDLLITNTEQWPHEESMDYINTLIEAGWPSYLFGVQQPQW